MILRIMDVCVLGKKKREYERYACFVRVEMCIIDFFFQAEDGIRDLVRSRGLGDVYKGQPTRRGFYAVQRV